MPRLKKIPTSYARFLTKNFQELKRGPRKLVNLESKAVWFDKETYLEALGIDPDTPTGIVDGKSIDGIRIYFGSYGDRDQRPEKREKLTLVLVPTVPGDAEDPHKDVLNDPHAYPADLSEEEKDEYNDGQLCPPNCDSGGLIDPDYQ